jgi:hypothetical protein
VGQRSVRRDNFFSLANSIKGRNDHCDLRSQIERFPDVRVVVDSLLVRIINAQSGDRCAEDLHWGGFFRKRLEKIEDRGWERAGCGQLL